MCGLESEVEATWREVTLRKARRRNDMRDNLYRDRVNRDELTAQPAEVFHSPLGRFRMGPISEKAEK